jgi:hypothetical protein
MAAMASTGRGMSVVYDKEDTDPGQCPEHHIPHFHQRRRRLPGRLHNRTGEGACPSRTGCRRAPQAVWPPSAAVVVAVTDGRLDFGTWEKIFYGEFDGRRRKRVLVKIIGE